MLPTLQQKRLSEGVVQELLVAMRTGQFKPGDKLPSERELSQAFGVSRVSVREGLRVLELLEVIIVRQGKGAFIATADVRPGGGLLRRWLLAHQEEVFELLEVREALEARAAASAADQAAAVVLPEVDEEADLATLVQADIAFHNAVADASGNAVLASLIRELNGVLEESRFAMFALPGRPVISHSDHRRIAQAIEKRDPEAAQASMREHIRRTGAEIAGLGAARESR
ncbi:MAG: FCD domain-containing protein [Actinomycetota bacterium]|nr:FCD domain-containing protein [Actinomycetota bacterium]